MPRALLRYPPVIHQIAGGRKAPLTTVTNNVGVRAVPDPKEKIEFTAGKFVIPSILLPTPSTSALRTSKSSGGMTSGARPVRRPPHHREDHQTCSGQ